MIGNLLSVLYLSVFLWAGCGLARKTVPTAGGALLLPLSCSYGLVLLAALPALFALFFGFALPAVLLGGAAALAAGAVLIFFVEWLGGLLMVTGGISPGSNAPLVEPG